MTHHEFSTPTRYRSLIVAIVAAVALVVGGCTATNSSEPVASGEAVGGTTSISHPASDTPTATAVSAKSSPPTRIDIPAIGVSTSLMRLGLQADGSMQVPPSGFPAGWYTGSPTPGQTGPSIIAGHVDWGGKPGVFYKLRRLAPGDSVTISRSDASTATFTVTHVEQYPKAEFPTSTVYGDIDHPGLRLITCGGSFDDAAASYDDNIVAYADLTTLRPQR